MCYLSLSLVNCNKILHCRRYWSTCKILSIITSSAMVMTSTRNWHVHLSQIWWKNSSNFIFYLIICIRFIYIIIKSYQKYKDYPSTSFPLTNTWKPVGLLPASVQNLLSETLKMLQNCKAVLSALAIGSHPLSINFKIW